MEALKRGIDEDEDDDEEEEHPRRVVQCHVRKLTNQIPRLLPEVSDSTLMRRSEHVCSL